MTERMEAVATFMPEGEGSWLAVNVEDKVQWAALRDEIMGWTDLAFAAEGEEIGNVRLHVQQPGFVAELPEFEGW